MASRRSFQLKEACRKRLIVRVTTRFEKQRVHGHVLAVIRDGLRFNGFECYCIRDVRTLEEDPSADFIETAHKMRRERVPEQPRVSLSSLARLLTSAGRAFGLVTIHQQREWPDACWIGCVLSVRRGSVALLEIDPHARWETESSAYRLNEVTRVDFGGGYEDALARVGGRPPSDFLWPPRLF